MKNTAAQNIAYIQKESAICVIEIAWVFDVSWRTIDKWMKGSPPSTLDTQRLADWAEATKILVASTTNIHPNVFRRTIAGGSSLHDAIKANSNVVELARILATILAEESQQRQYFAKHRLNQPTPSVSTTAVFGTPHLNEYV